MNLIEALQSELNRCRELIKLYESIPTGMFASIMIKKEIELAEKAIACGDMVEMYKCHENLRKCE